VLEERREQEFESFEDLDDRVPSLHNPQKVIAKRIETEINDPTEKYHLFARPPEDADRR
jgi:putative nucleotide binding protein